MVSCASWLLASSEQTCSSNLHRQLTHFFRKQTKRTKLNKQMQKRKTKKGNLIKTKKIGTVKDLSQEKQEKITNLPPEEESDDSNERSGG